MQSSNQLKVQVPNFPIPFRAKNHKAAVPDFIPVGFKLNAKVTFFKRELALKFVSVKLNQGYICSWTVTGKMDQLKGWKVVVMEKA